MKVIFEVVRWRHPSKNKQQRCHIKMYTSEIFESARKEAQKIYAREVVKRLGLNPHRLNIWGANFDKDKAPQISDIFILIQKVSITEKRRVKEFIEGYGDESIRTYPRIKKPVD